jgi:hypothetical protein
LTRASAVSFADERNCAPVFEINPEGNGEKSDFVRIGDLNHMQVPIFVSTGGDPLRRADVFELTGCASDKDLK